VEEAAEPPHIFSSFGDGRAHAIRRLTLGLTSQSIAVLFFILPWTALRMFQESSLLPDFTQSVRIFIPPPPEKTPQPMRAATKESKALVAPSPLAITTQTSDIDPSAIDLDEMTLHFQRDERHELLGLIDSRNGAIACAPAGDTRKLSYVFARSGSHWTTQVQPPMWQDRYNVFALRLTELERWSGISTLCSAIPGQWVTYAIFDADMERAWYSRIRQLASRARPGGKVRSVLLAFDSSSDVGFDLNCVEWMDEPDTCRH
jgi:hypothetical protein